MAIGTPDDHAGFLIPSWWVREPIEELDANICSIFFGFSLCLGIFAAANAVKQMAATWKRSKRISAYIVMVWLEWISNFIIAVLAWSYQRGYIRASLWFYLAIGKLLPPLICCQKD